MSIKEAIAGVSSEIVREAMVGAVIEMLVQHSEQRFTQRVDKNYVELVISFMTLAAMTKTNAALNQKDKSAAILVHAKTIEECFNLEKNSFLADFVLMTENEEWLANTIVKMAKSG